MITFLKSLIFQKIEHNDNFFNANLLTLEALDS